MSDFGPLRVTERTGWWVKGYLPRSNSVVEMGFDGWNQGMSTLSDSSITYLGLWSGNDCVFEFQLGTTTVMPKSYDVELDVFDLYDATRPPFFPRFVQPEVRYDTLPLGKIGQDHGLRDRPVRRVRRTRSGLPVVSRRYMSPTV